MKFEQAREQPLLAICLALIGIGNITIPNTIPVVSSSYLLLTVGLTCVLLLHRSYFVFRQLQYSAVVLFTFLSFLPGVLTWPLTEYGQTKLIAILVAFLLVIAPSAFLDVEKNVNLLIAVLFSISVTTVVFFLLFHEVSPSGRTILPGLNPIGTARACGLAVVLLIAWALLGRFRTAIHKIIFLALFISALLAMLMTGSRGPILSVFITLIFLVLFSRGSARRTGRFSWFMLFSGVAALVYLLSIDDEDSRLGSTDSSGRDILFATALRAVRDNPAGIGWGNFQTLFDRGWGGDVFKYPHNIFLEVAVEGGWFAFLCFVLLLLLATANVLRGARQGNEVATLLLSLLVFTIVNASLSSDIVGNRLMWLAIGLSILPFSREAKEVDGGTVADMGQTGARTKVRK